jgi:hypothetical protein
MGREHVDDEGIGVDGSEAVRVQTDLSGREIAKVEGEEDVAPGGQGVAEDGRVGRIGKLRADDEAGGRRDAGGG